MMAYAVSCRRYIGDQILLLNALILYIHSTLAHLVEPNVNSDGVRHMRLGCSNDVIT